MIRFGMKTRYYQNSLVSNVNIDECTIGGILDPVALSLHDAQATGSDRGCSSGACDV